MMGSSCPTYLPLSSNRVGLPFSKPRGSLHAAVRWSGCCTGLSPLQSSIPVAADKRRRPSGGPGRGRQHKQRGGGHPPHRTPPDDTRQAGRCHAIPHGPLTTTKRQKALSPRARGVKKAPSPTGGQPSWSTARFASPERTASIAVSTSSSGSRWEISWSSGRRPALVEVEDQREVVVGPGRPVDRAQHTPLHPRDGERRQPEARRLPEGFRRAPPAPRARVERNAARMVAGRPAVSNA